MPNQGESDAPLLRSEADQPAIDKVPGPALGDTVGTGTIIAFGCIGATLFLIVVGVVILLLLKVF